jgi:hypothetical protein
VTTETSGGWLRGEATCSDLRVNGRLSLNVMGIGSREDVRRNGRYCSTVQRRSNFL